MKKVSINKVISIGVIGIFLVLIFLIFIFTFNIKIYEKGLLYRTDFHSFVILKNKAGLEKNKIEYKFKSKTYKKPFYSYKKQNGYYIYHIESNQNFINSLELIEVYIKSKSIIKNLI